MTVTFQTWPGPARPTPARPSWVGRLLLCLAALWTLALLPQPAWAEAASRGWTQPPLQLRADAQALPVGGHMEFLVDPDATLTLADVATGEASHRFAPLDSNLNRGFTLTDTWVRLRLVRAPDADDTWYLEFLPSFLDTVETYVALTPADTAAPPADAYAKTVQGDSEPTANRLVRFRSFTQPLVFDGATQAWIYVHIHTTSATILSGQVYRLVPLMNHVSMQSMWLGFVLGVAMAVLISNLIYSYWLRERVYFLYGLYVMSLIGLAFGSFGALAQILPGPAPRLANLITGLSVCGGITSGALLTERFLSLRRTLPLVSLLNRIPIVLGILGMVATVADHYTLAGATLASVTSAYMFIYIGSSAWLARRGHPGALIYCLAFSSACVAALMGFMRTLGVIPEISLTEAVSQASALVHMILMNIAIASRVRQSEKERKEAQAAALEASIHAEQRALDMVALRTRELSAAKESLEHALAAERQAVREQIQFIDMVSHEYRTPVSIIRTGIDILQIKGAASLSEEGKGADGVKGHDLLKRMGRAVERLVEIIEVGLRRETDRSPGLQLETQLVRLDSVVTEAVRSLRASHPEQEVQVAGAVRAEIMGDPALLKTALLNLLENAAKYGPHGRPIRVELAQTAERSAVRVIDQGAGVAPADRERIFGKFVRLSSAERVPGIGVGLYLVRRIAELHDGRAYYDPARLDGCCLVLEVANAPAPRPHGL
ncbi:sensor histidine kinase [Nitrospirillum iridis]|uniref:histidine kinase n=1 Tax=Nitrospirillum iridis TaxID=765888 RepID=A0A7X0EDH6_9PROT|nr:sensor histidine kinase [Nitrospirillum iridis]MBB6252763.1 signal transduction histidine kinase [Nitrospirillum iridis]